MKLRNGPACVSTTLAVSMMSGHTFAQTAPLAANEPATLDTVIVTGVRASVKSALEAKKNSDQIEDSIVAEDIGKLPDNN